MKLFYSDTSPFVRKCLVSAHELGLREQLDLVAAAAHPIARDRALVAQNPLGKVPTLVTDEGAVLYDSRVICEYLNSVGAGGLIPPQPPLRWAVLVEQALADGLLDAAVLTRYETVSRPEKLRWTDWVAGQIEKMTGALGELERCADKLGARVDMGTIAIGCALGYLDFRFSSLAWRETCPNLTVWFERFGRRDSMVRTRPPTG